MDHTGMLTCARVHMRACVCVCMHALCMYISRCLGEGACESFCVQVSTYRPNPKIRYLAKGFEQLALGLWETYKFAGNIPASHHLLLPRIRGL